MNILEFTARLAGYVMASGVVAALLVVCLQFVDSIVRVIVGLLR